MNYKRLFLVTGLLAAFSGHAAGQNPTVNASVRLRAEAWNWFDTPQFDDSYVFGAAVARVAVSQQGPFVGWRLEAAAPVLLALPDNAIAPAPRGQLGLGAAYFAANDDEENAASVFLKQAFVRIGVPPGKRGGHLRAGRFEFIEGTETSPSNTTLSALKRDRIAHRLIGNFGFSHAQRSVDGVQIGVTRSRFNAVTALFRPTRGVFDVNGWGDLDINVGYVAVSGASSSERGGVDWRLFGIFYDDARDPIPTKVDNRPLTARQADLEDIEIRTYGGHYVRVMPVGDGSVDVLLWGAVQDGQWGFLDHSATAYAVEAGVQPAIAPSLKPWLRAGYNRTSGDESNTDGDHETFFQVLPTPRIYARMPFYNMMNVTDAFGTLILRPSATLTLRADAHWLKLSSANDLWYAGGGAFEKETFGYAGRPSQGSTDLARLFDLSADVRLSGQLSATGYLGLVRGGDVISRTYAGSSAALGYIEVEWRR